MGIVKQNGPLTEKEFQPYYDLWGHLFGNAEAESAKKQFMGAEKEYNDILVYSEWDGDTLLGTVHITTSKLVPSLSTIGCVATTEAARGRGVSRRVFQAVLDDFDAAGGQASYLGTGNPIAVNLYQSLGYYFMPGTSVMRRLSGGTNVVKFPQAFYEKSPCTVYKNSPYLRTLLVPLATAPAGFSVLDININLLNCGLFNQRYCESLYPRYMKLWESGGVTYSAHNKQGAACAIASLADNRIDAFWHPAYQEEAIALIKACEESAEKPYALLVKSDTEKQEIFESLGYKPGDDINLPFDSFFLPLIRFEK